MDDARTSQQVTTQLGQPVTKPRAPQVIHQHDAARRAIHLSQQRQRGRAIEMMQKQRTHNYIVLRGLAQVSHIVLMKADRHALRVGLLVPALLCKSNSRVAAVPTLDRCLNSNALELARQGDGDITTPHARSRMRKLVGGAPKSDTILRESTRAVPLSRLTRWRPLRAE